MGEGAAAAGVRERALRRLAPLAPTGPGVPPSQAPSAGAGAAAASAARSVSPFAAAAASPAPPAAPAAAAAGLPLPLPPPAATAGVPAVTAGVAAAATSASGAPVGKSAVGCQAPVASSLVQSKGAPYHWRSTCQGEDAQGMCRRSRVSHSRGQHAVKHWSNVADLTTVVQLIGTIRQHCQGERPLAGWQEKILWPHAPHTLNTAWCTSSPPPTRVRTRGQARVRPRTPHTLSHAHMHNTRARMHSHAHTHSNTQQHTGNQKSQAVAIKHHTGAPSAGWSTPCCASPCRQIQIWHVTVHMKPQMHTHMHAHRLTMCEPVPKNTPHTRKTLQGNVRAPAVPPLAVWLTLSCASR